jgi:hypothetical protein
MAVDALCTTVADSVFTVFVCSAALDGVIQDIMSAAADVAADSIAFKLAYGVIR